jgi:hypothetical protein
MSLRSGVRHMGGMVTGVGAGDGGGRRPGGVNNGARGVHDDDDVMGLNGGFLGTHSGMPLGKLTGSLLGSLSGSAILNSSGLGGSRRRQAGVLSNGEAGFYPGILGTVGADRKLSVNDRGVQATGGSYNGNTTLEAGDDNNLLGTSSSGPRADGGSIQTDDLGSVLDGGVDKIGVGVLTS